MHKREKSIFFIIVFITILWFLFILLDMPANYSYLREILFLSISIILVSIFIINFIKSVRERYNTIQTIEKALISNNIIPMITSQNEKIIETNKQFLKIAGYREPIFIIGKDIKNFFSEETYKKIYEFLSVDKTGEWIFLDGHFIDREKSISPVNLIIQKFNINGIRYEHINIINKDLVEMAIGEQFSIFDTILNNLNDVILFIDANNNINWINSSGEKYFPIRTDQIIGKKCHKLIFNNDSICNPCIIQESFKADSITEREIKNSDGRYYRITAQPIINAKGEYTGSIYRLSDITKQKEIEIKKIETEAKLSLISEQLPILIWLTDEDLKVTFAKGVVLKNVNISKEALIGKTLYEIFRTADPEHIVIKNALLALTGVSCSFQFDILGKHFTVYCEPFRSEEGKIVGCIGLSLDTTELINVQRELEKKNNILQINNEINKIISQSKSLEEMFDKIVNVIKNKANLKNVIYLEKDHSNETIYIKEAAEKNDILQNLFFVRFDKRENYNDPLLLCYFDKEVKIINDIEQFDLGQEYKKHLYELGYNSLLFIPIIIDDRIHSIFCFASAYKNEFKDISYLINVIDDIRFAIINRQLEERQRRNEEIIRQNQIMMVKAQKYEYASRFASTIAHDFNNILFSINSYLQLIIKDIQTDNRAQEYMNQIKMAVEKGGELTSYLMKYSTYDYMEKSYVKFLDIYNKTLNMLEELCKTKLVKFIPSNQLNSEKILCNEKHITEAILICARYLINRSRGNSTLFFQSTPIFLSDKDDGSLEDSAGMVKIEIMTDSLLPEELLNDDVFNVTILSKEEKQPEFNLPLLGNIIRLHGGYIYAEKGSEKSGFIIILPLSDKDKVKLEPKFNVVEEEKNILLVEDDPFVKEPIEMILKELRCNILTAPDGSEALKLIRRLNYKIDILITDVEMPIIDGITLAEEIYKYNKNTKIIYISGYIKDFASRERHFVPNSIFFQKPFPLEQLQKIVKDALKSS